MNTFRHKLNNRIAIKENEQWFFINNFKYKKLQTFNMSQIDNFPFCITIIDKEIVYTFYNLY